MLGCCWSLALCAISMPTIVGTTASPAKTGVQPATRFSLSASPGDAVVFFPFYTRVMLDYYRDRYSGNSAAVHVFAPPYYAGGDDVRTLVKAGCESASIPTRVGGRVWDDSQMDSFDYGAVADEKLRSIFGAPAVRKFADIHVLEFGR